MLALSFCVLLAWFHSLSIASSPPLESLVLDLDASKGVHLEDGNRVTAWTNQSRDPEARDFVKRDMGRQKPGSGRPTLRKKGTELNGKPSIIFRQQELVCFDEDTFDGLTTGKGHTWIAVMAVYDQRVGLKDVNSFFGNLRNGGKYEGLWVCLDDDNTLWCGGRNGITFGRFDKNNPKLSGQKLLKNRFHLLAGRMGSGTGTVKTELYVGDSAKPYAEGTFLVNPKANPSLLTIGQERDAIQHPGKESFDGEIARLLIWERPLTDSELKTTFRVLKTTYNLQSDASVRD
jgi:hypothetical protein